MSELEVISKQAVEKRSAEMPTSIAVGLSILAVVAFIVLLLTALAMSSFLLIVIKENVVKLFHL